MKKVYKLDNRVEEMMEMKQKGIVHNYEIGIKIHKEQNNIHSQKFNKDSIGIVQEGKI